MLFCMVQPSVDGVYIRRYAGLNSPCKWFIVIGIFSGAVCRAVGASRTVFTFRNRTNQKKYRRNPGSKEIGGKQNKNRAFNHDG